MKRILFLLALASFSICSLSQTINDTVLIVLKTKGLTQQQEISFDTIQSQIYNLNDVRYLKK